MGEIRPKKCEGREAHQGSTLRSPPWRKLGQPTSPAAAHSTAVGCALLRRRKIPALLRNVQACKNTLCKNKMKQRFMHVPGSFEHRRSHVRGLPGAATAVRCNASLRTPTRQLSGSTSDQKAVHPKNAVFKLAHVAVCRDAADIPSVHLLRVVMPAAEECFAWAAAGGRGWRRLVHQPMMPLHDAFPVRDCSKRHAKISAQAALTKQISPGAIVSSIGEVTAQAASAAPPPWPPLAIDSGSSQKCLWTATCERGQMTLFGQPPGRG